MNVEAKYPTGFQYGIGVAVAVVLVEAIVIFSVIQWFKHNPDALRWHLERVFTAAGIR